MDYVPPSSFYDIFPNDFLHWNFPAPAANLPGGAPEGTPRYGLQYPGGGGPAPVLTTPAEAPAFQLPAPVERTFSTDSSTDPSSLSYQSPPPGSSVAPSMLSFQDLTQLSQMQGVSPAAAADAPSTKRRTKKRNGPPRRRGPNKRLKGSGYFDMMVRFYFQRTLKRRTHAFVLARAPRGRAKCYHTGISRLLRNCEGKGSIHRTEAPFREAALQQD